ncbi:putative signal transduction protein [Dethiosulfovibrio peptidovorans DSM 11002]|uniref:Signal transduction protein n=1 Tax=Dethiosulfovibrio peptidovorans DSM 11002 TaxID=469381 RepID=D2Z4L7_9BACT|nr:HDOD domain-containing protein [Dethiosulfovibrio peptidovorans]EFC92361.1 putative signal transduction protein [Dethiosulfovibrio peptidovorans DSM 11002]
MDDRTRQLIQNRILSRLKEVKSFPQFVMETLRALDNPDSSAYNVAGSLSKDEGLVIRTLKLANSAFYGLPRKISSIQEAVALLGYKTIKNLVIAATVYQRMDNSFAGYALDRGDLWKHSLSVAYAARYLAERTKACLPDEAYIVGMLHAIGKIVLNDYIKFGYQIIVRIVDTDKIPFVEAERMVLGFDHAQVGAMLVEKWNLPESHKVAIQYQYSPDELPEDLQEYRGLVDIIHLANSLVLMLGVSGGADALQYSMSETVLQRLGLEGEVEELLSDLVDIMDKVSEEMELMEE